MAELNRDVVFDSYITLSSSIGNIVFLSGTVQATKAECLSNYISRSAILNPPSTITVSVLSAYYSASYYVISDNSVTLTDSNITIGNNGVLSSLCFRYLQYYRCGNLGWTSGTSSHISFPFIVKTSDNYFLVACANVDINYDNSVYSNLILPTSNTIGQVSIDFPKVIQDSRINFSIGGFIDDTNEPGVDVLSDYIAGNIQPEEQYPFFLLNQYNSPSALQLTVNSDRWGYDESTSPHSNFAYGAANNTRITCFKIGSMIYFCSLFRNTLTEEILYYANNISGTTGEAIDPSSWQLNQLHNIYYYYTQSYTDIFKEMPVYSSSDLSLALADAYDFLIEGADPYEEKGGASTTGGGTGNGTDGTDTQTMPGDPGLSALSLGLCTAFIPSSSALNSLANFLFGANTTILDELAKLFGDPMKAIIGLHILPVSPTTAGSGVITLGNVNTGVTSGYTATQYIDVDCGSVSISEYWGSYLDYDPYTQYEIYLPFIGIKSLDSNDVVEHTLSVKYKVDVLSGACVCFVFSDSNLLYSYSGSCSQQIPLTESQYSNLLSGAITVAASVGSLIATEGGSAGIAIPAIASSSVNMAKQQITRSGSLTGNAGQMGVKTPFVIRHKPIQAIPGSQNSYLGYPSFITERIGNLTGYTEFYEVHLNGLTCTDEEKDELESLMKGGVLL